MEIDQSTQGNTTPQGSQQDGAGQGERTFTQEEVNRIVQERLARVKAEPSGRDTELDRREQEITMRERRMYAHERFRSEGLPDFLLDFLDYSGDEGKLDEAIGKMSAGYNSQKHLMRGVPDYNPAGGRVLHDDPDETRVREAMGLKTIWPGSGI